MKKIIIFLLLVLLVPSTALASGVMHGSNPEKVSNPVSCTDTVSGRCMLDPGQAFKVLDSCDAVTGWSALSNDTTGLATDNDHVLGSKSIEFDKVDGAANKKYAGISRALSSLNLSEYFMNEGFAVYSLNISATTDIDYCFLRLGDNSSNYNEWRVDDDQLVTGWQRLKFNLVAPNTSGNTGTGLDIADVDYMVVGCLFDAETDTLADLRIDDIRIQRSWTTLADLGAYAISSVLPGVVNVVELGSQAIDLGAGAVGTGTQRGTLASDDPAVVALQVIDDWDESDRAKVNVIVGQAGVAAGAGAVGVTVPRMTLASDDPAVTNLSDIEGLLTSDNDTKELADYFDSTSQLSPLYVNDVGLTLDNEPISDAVASIYEEILETTDGTSIGDLLDDALYTAGAGGTRLADIVNSALTALQIIDDWDAVHDSAASADGPQVMGEARTSQMTAVDNGDAVRFATNSHGEIVIAGYAWTSDGIKVLEQDPISEQHTETTPVDETNLTDDTTAYAYWDMDGYREFSLQCDMNIETDSITATLECTVQDDGTAQASCFYSDVTSDLAGVASVVDSDFIWIVDTSVAFKYCRLKYVTSADEGDDSDLTCYLKRMF